MSLIGFQCYVLITGDHEGYTAWENLCSCVKLRHALNNDSSTMFNYQLPIECISYSHLAIKLVATLLRKFFQNCT